VNLIAVHRLLIKVFIGAALVFGGIMLRRSLAGEANSSMIGAIAALALAVIATVYLFRAPYLRRK
jgi:hypothetical protein